MKSIGMPLLHILLLIGIIAAPFIFPNYQTQLATLWLFIICLLYTSPSPRD